MTSVHDAPGARFVGQLLPSVKGAVTVMLLKVSTALPVFVRVIVCVSVVTPRVPAPRSIAGGSTTCGAWIPVPVRLDEIVDAPLVTNTVPLAGPIVLGKKTTLVLHDENPAMALPQLVPTTWKGPVVPGAEIGAGEG